MNESQSWLVLITIQGPFGLSEQRSTPMGLDEAKVTWAHYNQVIADRLPGDPIWVKDAVLVRTVEVSR